jgi:hypothetical protein
MRGIAADHDSALDKPLDHRGVHLPKSERENLDIEIVDADCAANPCAGALPIVAVAAVCLGSAAEAQHKHGSKGPNGGAMEDVAGVHAELVTSGNAITFNILDEDSKPIKASGYTGSILVVGGSERETIQLAPSGDSALKGEAKKPTAKGASITLMLKTDKGKSGQARFTP